MNKEEKITLLTDLINVPGNTTKLVKALLLQAVINMEDEAQLDNVISILQEE